MSIYEPKKPKRINSVSVTLTLTLLIGGYLGWFYLPHWFAVWRLTGIMMTVGRQAYREFKDDLLMEKLVKDARRTGLAVSADNFAVQREGFTEDELFALPTDYARDLMRKRGKKISISFAITIDAAWPFLDKKTPLYFENYREVDLRTESW